MVAGCDGHEVNVRTACELANRIVSELRITKELIEVAVEGPNDFSSRSRPSNDCREMVDGFRNQLVPEGIEIQDVLLSSRIAKDAVTNISTLLARRYGRCPERHIGGFPRVLQRGVATVFRQ